MLTCIICKGKPDEDLPTFCKSCFIVIPQIRNGEYLGRSEVTCGNCSYNFSVRRPIKCPSCGITSNLDNRVSHNSQDVQQENRKRNRDVLAKQIIEDEQMKRQVLGLIGLDRLQPVEQAVALSAISKEKLHPLSGEYDPKEARTLIDLAVGLADQLKVEWATIQVRSRLATYYIRSGREMTAVNILNNLLSRIEVVDDNKLLQKLELMGLLALAHRIAGNAKVAEELVENVYTQLGEFFEGKESDIQEYINSENKFSQLLGPGEDLVSYPRVDMIADILAILVEEAFSRGDSESSNCHDRVIEHMLELDNMVNILYQMSPRDDPGYFASFLREFIRLFVALTWYPDFLIHNDDVKRQILLEQSFQTINLWMRFIPIEYWLQLRPARLIEIFTRIGEWNDKIDGNGMLKHFLEKSSSHYLPSFLYIAAEAKLHLGEEEEAIKFIDRLLGMEEVNETLITLAEKLRMRSQLEYIGILTETINEDSRINLPVKIEIQTQSTLYEPETYMRDLDDKLHPVLKLNFTENVQYNIAIFGERLFHPSLQVQSSIISLGSKYFNDYYWDYGQQLLAWGIEDPSNFIISGYRMEMVVIKSKLNEEDIYLLLEGQMQKMDRKGNELKLHSSKLLFLKGVIFHGDIVRDDILNVLVQLLTDEVDITRDSQIYCLKAQD